MDIKASRFCFKWTMLLVVALRFVAPHHVSAAAENEKAVGPDQATYEKSVSRGVEFLTKNQTDDGSYSSEVGPGITAIAATAMLRHGRTPNDPVVANPSRIVAHR